jgi:hypothetical protein
MWIDVVRTWCKDVIFERERRIMIAGIIPSGRGFIGIVQNIF